MTLTTLYPVTSDKAHLYHHGCYVEWGEAGGKTIYACWLNIIPVTIHICSLPFKIIVVSQTHCI